MRGRELGNHQSFYRLSTISHKLSTIWAWFRNGWRPDWRPEHLRRGSAGEQAARQHLKRAGLKFLTGNFRSRRGEIDLVFRDRDCLVFVEVKTRTAGGWLRPAAAVNQHKRRLLSRVAFDYLRLIKQPPVRVRFDVVEVLLEDGRVCEVRHLPNTFALVAPYRYG